MIFAPVLTDLDGELFDTTTNVIACRRASPTAQDFEPVCALKPSLIGSPQIPNLRKPRGDMPSGTSVEALVGSFNVHHDNKCDRAGKVIDPMPVLLDKLSAQCRHLHIFTDD